MTAVDLGSLLYRTQARLEAAPPSTVAETRAVAVDPLLEALGWDVHGPGTAVEVGIGDVQFAYCCSVEETPALCVALESYTDPLDEERWQEAREAMAATGVPAALYTNGRAVRMIGGESEHDGELLEFAGEDSSLFDLTPEAVGEQIGDTRRERVAVRLATQRDRLVEDITDDLVDVGGHEFAGVLGRGAAEFVDRLVGALAGAEAAETIEYSDPSEVETSGEESPLAATPTDAEGEYVAKFFDGSTRVGGVGDSTSVGALVGGAEFLLERGLAGSQLPWPPDGDEVILHRAPLEDDGSQMSAARELSNGLVLNVGGTVDDRKRRLEALAARAGLRVMLTGDWGG